MTDLMREIGNLQNEYQKLLKTKKLTKKAMCELIVPFRDKYGLKDLQTLQIARGELSILEIVNLFDKTDIL